MSGILSIFSTDPINTFIFFFKLFERVFFFFLLTELSNSLLSPDFRARKHLSHFVDVIGPRPFGSPENSVASLDYLVKQIERIQREAGSAQMSYYVDTRPGHIVEEYKNGKYLRMWNRMQNVIVTLNGKGDSEVHRNALLVSAHYDTVTMSPGATDNTLSVACLLETLEVLAHSSQGERDLVVAFVNGEESGLLGATHFLSDPISFSRIGTFINLDGTPGDKSMLFRSTGGWMDFIYAAVPHPLGFVVAEDIFNLGIVNSDTDWSVYKTAFNGLDWATFSHRQTYHTIKDTKISIGAPQYLGENLLTIVRKIIDLRTDDPIEKQVSTPDQKHVFWSFLNSGFAVYSMTTSIVIHATIAGIILITLIAILIHRSFRWKDAFQFAATHPARIAAFGFLFSFLSLISVLIITLLGVLFTFYLARYFAWSNTPMGVWAFAFPAITAFLFVQWLITLGERKYKVVMEVSRLHVLWGYSIMAFVLLMATIYLSIKNVGSTYLLYLSFSTIPVQLIVQHVFYLLGYMSDDRSEYIPLANEENMALLTRNTMGYGMTHNVVDEEKHLKSHRPKVDSKTTHFMWFIIFIIGAIPLIFIADILPVLFDFASSTVPSAMIGMAVGLVVYLFGMQLMPVVRRGGHLGVLTVIIFIVAITCFFSFTMVQRDVFTDKSPYVVIPRSENGSLILETLEPYSMNLHKALERLKERNGPIGFEFSKCSANKYECTASLNRHLNLNATATILDNSPSNFTWTFESPESQYHRFTVPGNCNHFELFHNGTTTKWDLSSEKYGEGSIFEIMLMNPSSDPWQLTFTGPKGKYTWSAGYTRPNVLHGFPELLNKVKTSDFMTFMGDGVSLHTHQTDFNLV
jgi:hypothetical protein